MSRAGLVLTLLLAACGGGDTGTRLEETAPVVGSGAVSVGVQPDSGDRRVEASGDITRVEPIAIGLESEIVWTVAAATPEGISIVAVLADGGARWIQLGAGEPRIVDLGPAPAGPPLVSFGSQPPSFVAPEPASPAPPSEIDGTIWWTAADGAVHRGEEDLGFSGLPDGRIVVATDGSVAVLSQPTTSYPHGVLGDDVEAGAITILEPDGVIRAEVAVDGVVEGLSPLWADLDADGRDELVVTVSDSSDGARLVVFDADGVRVAVGEPIGTGNRWRHQIGTVTDPHGTTAVVVVRTPHIGGVAEYWRLVGPDLIRFDTRSGITSHTLGSRNLDLALVADADGDDIAELIAPTSDLRTLVGLVLSEDGVGQPWAVELPGRLSSNLHAVADASRLWLVAGLEDGTLLVWPPVASTG